MLGLDKRIKAMYGVDLSPSGEKVEGVTGPFDQLEPGREAAGKAGLALALLAIIVGGFFYASLSGRLERSHDELLDKLQAVEAVKAANAKLGKDLAALQAKVEAIDVAEARMLLARSALGELEQKAEALAAVLDGAKPSPRLEAIRAAIAEMKKEIEKK